MQPKNFSLACIALFFRFLSHSQIKKAIEKHTESSKEYIGKRSEEFFDSMRERKLKSIDFWKNAMRDSPEKEKEKVLEEKKMEKRVVRDCMFSLPENEKEYEDTKRCRPEKKQSLAAHLSPTNPEPDDTPPRTLAEARKCTFWKGFEKAIESELTQLEKNNTWEYIDRNSLPKHKHSKSEICVRYQERRRRRISEIQSKDGSVWIHTSRRS